MPESIIGKLTSRILASYERVSSTHRIGHVFLPSQERIVGMLVDMRRLLFPGYFGRKDLAEADLRAHVEHLVARLREELKREIAACLATDRCAGARRDDPELDAEAERAALAFLQAVPEIRDALAYDARAAYDGDPAAKSIDEIIYSYPGFYAVTVYRVAHKLYELAVPLMPRILSEHAHGLTGTDIHPGAEIGRSFFIDHATGVVIGETTEIGDNVKVYQGVTLGALSIPQDERGRAIKGRKRHPSIGDDVTIYANATILGGETFIAPGVTIPGNTFVTSSVSGRSDLAGR